MISRRWLVSMLLAVVLLMAGVALARGAPNKKAFSPVTVHAVAVANVAPVTTEYDVIQNLSTEPRVSNTRNQVYAVTTDCRRQSTTGDERIANQDAYDRFGRSSPGLVMLA